MDKIIDYAKYTTALAVALLLYIPANLLPTESIVHHCILGLTSLMAALSALFGILFYTRVTRVILDKKESDDKAWSRTWGTLHMALLVVAYIIGGIYFFADKVIMATPEKECSAAIPGTGTSQIVIKFKCSSGAS